MLTTETGRWGNCHVCKEVIGRVIDKTIGRILGKYTCKCKVQPTFSLR